MVLPEFKERKEHVVLAKLRLVPFLVDLAEAASR